MMMMMMMMMMMIVTVSGVASKQMLGGSKVDGSGAKFPAGSRGGTPVGSWIEASRSRKARHKFCT